MHELLSLIARAGFVYLFRRDIILFLCLLFNVNSFSGPSTGCKPIMLLSIRHVLFGYLFFFSHEASWLHLPRLRIVFPTQIESCPDHLSAFPLGQEDPPETQYAVGRQENSI